MMRIGFIGAGKVGVSLGKFFREGGLPVSGYYNRHREAAQAAADFREKYGAEPPKLEPTQANLYADEEHYIELARAWCVENHIACAIK